MKFSLTIMVPCYNEEKRILPLLKSLEQQSVKPEVVFVDGGSTDNTAKLVIGFSKRNKNFRLIRESGNRSPANARNMGIRAAKGNLLVFLNADTIIEKDYTKKITEVFSDNPKADVIYVQLSPKIPEKISVFQKAVFFRDEYSVFSFDSKPHGITKTAAQKKIGYFDSSLGFGEDRHLDEHGLYKAKVNIVNSDKKVELTRLSYPTFGGFFSRGMWYGRTIPMYLAKVMDCRLCLYYALSVISVLTILTAWLHHGVLLSAAVLLAIPFAYGCYKALIVASRGYPSLVLVLIPFLEVVQFVSMGIGFFQYASGNRTVGR